MQYAKPPLTFDKQADKLIARGLIADKAQLVSCLETVNYYRLSAYLYPYRIKGQDQFQPTTHFIDVWNDYLFDRELRLLVNDAIERVEVAVRSQLLYHFSHEHGAFGYMSKASMPNLKVIDYCNWIKSLDGEIGRRRKSKEPFIEHFYAKYSDNELPPIWMVAEVMTFGTMLTFFRGTSQKVKANVSKQYKIPIELMESWLLTLNAIRNISAHHSRLWNRVLGNKPLMPYPKHYPEWTSPVAVNNDRIFGVLTILCYFLSIIDLNSDWAKRVDALITKYPNTPIHWMGFSSNWKDCPIWNRML